MINEIKVFLKEKKYSDLKEFLKDCNVVDISDCLDELNAEDTSIVYRLLDKDIAVEVFSFMEVDTQEELIKILSDKELKYVIENLFVDDAVDLISEMPAVLVKRILNSASKEQRASINELLKYPETSAGSIMTTEYVNLSMDTTVTQAFDRIRKTGVDKETIYTCYVTDKVKALVGVVSVKTLLLADGSNKMSEIMEDNIIKAYTHDDKEDVARLFDKYDFLALPVVDSEDRLVGIITVDDAIDVMQEEVSEDFEIMAGMKPSDDSYFKMGVFQHARNRIVWLFVLMVSATITGQLITYYEEAFEALPLLVSFIPMLMDTGGNCGSQSSTQIIRGLATEEIHLKEIFKCMWTEFRVSLLVGAGLCAVNFVRIAIQYKDTSLAFILSATLFCTVVIAKLLGCTLPMLAKKLKFDPAIMASPFITTIVDACSIFIYFNIAIRVLGL